MFKNVYRLLAVISVLSILLAGAVAPVSAVPWKDKVDPWVLHTASAGRYRVPGIPLTTQADLSQANALSTKLEKGTYVYQTLASFAERTQSPLITELDKLGVEYRPYWIANMIWVRGGLSTVQLLATRSDVAHLYANPQVMLDEPTIDVSANRCSHKGLSGILSRSRLPMCGRLGFHRSGCGHWRAGYRLSMGPPGVDQPVPWLEWHQC